MKHLFAFILFAFAISILAPPVQAQFPAQIKSFAVTKVFANDQADTSAVQVGLGMYNNVGVVFTATDSTSLKIYIDTRPYGGSTWTMKDSTTIASVVNAGTVVEWAPKGPTVDKIATPTASFRLRSAFAAAGNGWSSPAYTLRLYYSK